MKTLICGSIAYDNIMVFQGHFKDHILPHQIHILNVSFLVPELRREWGGCAANIAYNMKLLGADPLVMATVGDDAGAYLDRFTALGIDCRHVRHIPGTLTAQAFITTDFDSNQITAFHTGAMQFSHENEITPECGAQLAIIGPDGREGMLRHARDCHASGIPFVFDPGQAMPLFSAADLLEFMQLADYAVLNDYEAQLLSERTEHSLESLAAMVRALVVTRGGEGSWVLSGGIRHDIPCVPAREILDPTGCGDAYRAGLLVGIQNGWDWPKTGRLASLLGAIKIAHRGCQNHTPTRADIARQYEEAFGETLW